MSISPKVFECLSEALDNNDCEELYLDGLEVPSFDSELKSKVEKVSSLTVLSMNECKLLSLKNFPALPNLVRLELTGNEFPGAELASLTHLKEMQSLTLSSNKITSFEEVEILKKFSNLFQLDLSETEVSEKDGYRAKVFSLLPGLKILDNKDNDGVSVDYEDNDDDFVEDEEYIEEDEELEDDDDDEEYDENEAALEEEADMGKPTKRLKQQYNQE